LVKEERLRDGGRIERRHGRGKREHAIGAVGRQRYARAGGGWLMRAPACPTPQQRAPGDHAL